MQVVPCQEEEEEEQDGGRRTARPLRFTWNSGWVKAG